MPNTQVKSGEAGVLQEMQQDWLHWFAGLLDKVGIPLNDITLFILAVSIIIITAFILHFILHKLVLKRLYSFSKKSSWVWIQVLTEDQLFNRLAFVIQGIVLLAQANFWVQHDVTILYFLIICTKLWILLYILLSIFSFFNIVLHLSNRLGISNNLPLGGIFQGIKLLASLFIVIMMISAVIDQSPWKLITGLGAMAAVIMLVFKDSILGLAAGIQLSANKMLRIGDWLTMEKYGADGTVIDIGLTTVKVQNFDNTMTMIPTYALVSDSFINWRAMQESGGRRIKRSILIDANSIRFLTKEEIEKLSNSALLKPYILERAEEIDKFNKEKNYDLDISLLNGRRLTNLGLYRAYLEEYLKNHPSVHRNMTCMVRQMAPDFTAIPLEIYCFSNTVVWKQYEAIQSDIFDHSYSVLSEFFLSAGQSGTGNSSTVRLLQGPDANMVEDAPPALQHGQS
ncbi:Small-conductance mechanosensitive channel (MscS) (PDB:2OAU) [Commensalibacter communis]|uniref:mechanosensitive ion channel family protein n=1 Tax=Commensalibacter communis TaxID=2972786 RepID=UPI0022FF5720|nr:mechanosensitive ion channel domain-containing protein [Commensalibacter communis]CAI3958122.1 Small-conductance mechanosensitive channel (MscS) (PDB:2OAU) [Commensalibacter communis]